MRSTPKSSDDILEDAWCRCTKILSDIEDATAKGSWVFSMPDKAELAEALYEIEDEIGFQDMVLSAQRHGFRMTSDEMQYLVRHHAIQHGSVDIDESHWFALAA